MKKKLAIFACAVVLMLTFTVVCFAEEEAGGNGEVMWDLWKLLSFENVDYFGVIGTLITTVITFLKMIFGGSAAGSNIMNAIKTFFDFLK